MVFNSVHPKLIVVGDRDKFRVSFIHIS